MKKRLLAIAALALFATPSFAAPPKWAIVVHGGAGVIERKDLTPELDKAYRDAMNAAVAKGSKILADGGGAMDAIEAVVRDLEDDPLFNAGRGAVFTADGRNELDAAFMDGKTLKAGAVAGVTRTKHPITLARAVMEKSKHVMLIGQGADAFAASQGVEQVDPSYFFTERRWQGLVKALTAQGLPIPPRPAGAPAPQAFTPIPDDRKYGTVGVVALDSAGNIAAGTSTGGTVAKRWGRVGDSPIIGAGTYASNQSCAVSATGTGEFFIRLTVARDICALVQYGKAPLQKAADTVVQQQLTALGGDGGVIAVAPDGQIAWSFNTPGMYRASAAEGRPTVVSIYKDEP
ncbi:isoaspartyl peptidase/L-asparaginase family protein [Caulobacter mirabilis]|uniref:Isoaspartyl peptidase n=1 Tax=Caulobacter mirabilis TaxID=69666 RepID=A0A2D2AWB0_9CAUL|nr:isoaspartyl peptidase/L-asparaginase [Caulobacter mirabilis]ATQ42237.1 isoaspartyl peptidase/L-asparaginase [Caulobacter mirabilis]